MWNSKIATLVFNVQCQCISTRPIIAPDQFQGVDRRTVLNLPRPDSALYPITLDVIVQATH